MSERVIELRYFWLDGDKTSHLRTKTKFMRMPKVSPNMELSDIPDWSFDGSSTYQAETGNSDMILKPVKVYVSNANQNLAYVLCEVFNLKGKPHISNTRADMRKIIESNENANDLLFGLEQEYVFINTKNQQPYGWPERYDEEEKQQKTFFPGPQGRYYCGTGNFIRGKEIVQDHARRCIDLNLSICGINSEVCLSQWEYQLGPQTALDVSDDLWMARFLYEEVAEDYYTENVAIEYFPKIFKDNDDWAGTGCHINFSTPTLRTEQDNKRYIDDLLVGISEDHKHHIKVYGEGNEFRLNGKNETCHIDSFEWGDSDRSVAMRIPNGANHIEDRRPGGNINPYEAISAIMETILRVDGELSSEVSEKEKATA